MKQEREHWIALFPVQYSLNILFGRRFFSRLVIMGNPSAANETLEPFKDRQFIHGLHQPHSDAEFSIVGGHGNIDDIKGVSIVLMCADIPVVRHFIPAVVRMMRIKISHERCHRTDDAAFGNCAKRSIGKSFKWEWSCSSFHRRSSGNGGGKHSLWRAIKPGISFLL